MAESAPGSAVLCRLVTSGEGSDWPLSRKYGCSTYEAVDILIDARELGPRRRRRLLPRRLPAARPRGLGRPDRCRGPGLRAAARRGVCDPRLLDLGGGFPAAYDDGCLPVAAYGEAIERPPRPSLRRRPPGRSSSRDAASSGTPARWSSSVIGVVDRGGVRWVYLDAGVFTGLVETLDEAIRYRLDDHRGRRSDRTLRAGRADLRQRRRALRGPMVDLPLALAEGDEVRLLSAGAYTTCYSTRGVQRVRSAAHRGQDAADVRQLDGPTRRVIVSHAIGALAVSLPWPLLLVLVAEHTDDPWLLGLAGSARMLPYVAVLVGRPPGWRTPSGATSSCAPPWSRRVVLVAAARRGDHRPRLAAAWPAAPSRSRSPPRPTRRWSRRCRASPATATPLRHRPARHRRGGRVRRRRGDGRAAAPPADP